MTTPADSESVRCPHCATWLMLPWMVINRRATQRQCTKCGGAFLIRADVKLEVLKLRDPKRGTLPTGDYTLRGLEDQLCVERKSLSDLIGCMTSGRERFEREMQRMLAFPQRGGVIESSFSEMARGEYRSQLPGTTALNTLASWTGRFSLPFIFTDDRDNSAQYVTHFLIAAAKREYQRLKLLGGK